MRCALLPTDAAVAIATVGISSCCFPRRAAVYAATTNCMQPFVLMAVVICWRNFCAHKHVQRNGSSKQQQRPRQQGNNSKSSNSSSGSAVLLVHVGIQNSDIGPNAN